jgi:hypothetical protein
MLLVVHGGEPLVFANGYPMSFAPPALRFKLFPNFIYDLSHASSIPVEYRPQDHTLAADVALVKRSGAICVKTFYERELGSALHLSHPDSNRALFGKSMYESNSGNGAKVCALYAQGQFLGTYEQDCEPLIHMSDLDQHVVKILGAIP